ncbi:hypothetical protein SAMN05216295_11315 [Pseudomonas luteola]|nr:hypothetical protein SAMN05216295_11315 [Pseudomonas zeshuii]
MPITGRIYEYNRADDRLEKSIPHYLWGEFIYELLGFLCIELHHNTYEVMDGVRVQHLVIPFINHFTY